MLYDITKMLPRGNAKTIVSWKQVNDNIHSRVKNWKQRFDGTSPTFSQGVELLKFLVLNIDLEYILTIKSDIDRYTLVIAYLADARRAAYDPVYSGSVARKLFLEDQRGIPEFILNVTINDPAKDYPFDLPYSDSKWQQLRAMRLLHHDANELVSGLLNWKISFDGPPPSRVLIELDVTTLIFKYVKYVELCRTQGTEPSVSTFIQEGELRHLFDDFHKIWQINLINLLLASTSEQEDATIIKSSFVPQFYCSISQVQRAAQDILIQRDLLQQGSIKVQDFLATPWLRTGSVIDAIDHLDDRSLPTTRQYKYLQLMKELPYLKMVAIASRLFDTASAQNRQVMKKIEFSLRNIKRENLASSILNSRARQVFERELNQLYQVVGL